MLAIRRVFAHLFVFAVLLASNAPVIAGPEEELGPEKMALADEVVEKVIYGIRFEGLRGEKIRAVIKAWADYYIKEGLITQRDSMMMQVYIGRAATLHQQGVEHIPYAERQKQ